MKLMLICLILFASVGCKTKSRVLDGSALPPGCHIENRLCPQQAGLACQPGPTLVCE